VINEQLVWLIIVIYFVVTIFADISWLPNHYGWKVRRKYIKLTGETPGFWEASRSGNLFFFICGCLCENPHDWCYFCR